MKNLYNHLLLFGMTVILVPAFAQQESQFGNYIHNPYIYNPAAGGMSNVAQIDLGYRNQWIAASGNPTTIYLSGHTQITGKKSGKETLSEFNNDHENIYKTPERTVGELKHIIGAKFMNDGIGPFQKTSTYGSYAVHLPLTKKVNIGVGLSAGWGNFQINPNKVILQHQDDNTYNQFMGQTMKQNNLDIESGLVLYSNRFLFSLSGTQLLNNSMIDSKIETGNTLNRHLFIISSYRFTLADKVDLEPFVIIKGVKNSPTSFDLGARVRYNQSMWAGIQYRRGNTFVISAGMNFLKNFNFSYAFEYGTAPVRISSAGTHELQLGILIGKNRNTDKEIEKSKKAKSTVTTPTTPTPPVEGQGK